MSQYSAGAAAVPDSQPGAVPGESVLCRSSSVRQSVVSKRARNFTTKLAVRKLFSLLATLLLQRTGGCGGGVFFTV